MEEPIARIVEKEGEESPQDLDERRLGQTARRHGRISEGFPNSENEQLKRLLLMVVHPSLKCANTLCLAAPRAFELES